MSQPVNVAIIGVGNCASSLVQGVEYYKDAKPDERLAPLRCPTLPRKATHLPSPRASRSCASRRGASATRRPAETSFSPWCGP